MDIYRDRSLDDFFQDHAKKSIPKDPKLGKLYNVALPSNFTGMEVSVVHLQSSSVWAQGANLSYFHVPPRIIPSPNVTWLDLVFSNLGNWSSYYYDIPNYTFVTPIIGFSAYGVSHTKGKNGHFTSTTTKLDLPIIKQPIMVRFPSVWLPQGKCAKFYSNGRTTITNMSLSQTCEVWGQGYFAIIVRVPPSHQVWKWWVIGFGVGSIGFFLCGVLLCKLTRFVEDRNIEKMERQSEKNEVLDTTYVGNSRMPCACGIRTQPVLENDYFP
ncbi:G-box binding, multifunctional mosaic region containing protein [Tanacetum coccineum]